jgi:hypothetical protein
MWCGERVYTRVSSIPPLFRPSIRVIEAVVGSRVGLPGEYPQLTAYLLKSTRMPLIQVVTILDQFKVRQGKRP